MDLIDTLWSLRCLDESKPCEISNLEIFLTFDVNKKKARSWSVFL